MPEAGEGSAYTPMILPSTTSIQREHTDLSTGIPLSERHWHSHVDEIHVVSDGRGVGTATEGRTLPLGLYLGVALSTNQDHVDQFEGYTVDHPISKFRLPRFTKSGRAPENPPAAIHTAQQDTGDQPSTVLVSLSEVRPV